VYLRALPPGDYADRLVAYLREQGYDWPEERVRAAAPLVQEKIETLGEFPAFAGFFFADVEPDPELLDGRVLYAAADALGGVDEWEPEPLETALKALCERLGLKPRQAFAPIRVAVTGSKVSPGLYESLALLGREESLARLNRAVARAGAATA
jgi:glutamyl-tRNA synthetase